ncbi:MAG: hypothetical protein PVG70_02170 [Desulfobacterales bacterium]|jgi:hypothetical protein
MQKRIPGNPKFIKIAVLENTIEAQLISSMLNQLDIPHQINSFYDTAYDGLFQMQRGWGELRAPSYYERVIQDVINDVRTDHVKDENG